MEKRDSLSGRAGSSKRGQITVFIILGIILLFTAIMVYQITVTLNKSKLDTEKQKILNKLLQPAAMNIYVDDCLRDNLKEGLKLLGQQGGKFWVGQPGGYAEFSNLEGKTAPDPYQEKESVDVAYGLAYYPAEPANKYPCTGNPPAPAFCQYVFPNLKAKYSFGSLSGAGIFEIETSLGNYLSDTTAVCIEKALNEKMLAGKAELKIDEAKVVVSLQSSGVQVEAMYPLILSYGKEKIGAQQKFSFAYPGRYKDFFGGVSELLYNDIHFLDFDLQEDYSNKEFDYQSDFDTESQCKKQENSNPSKETYLCKGYNHLSQWGIQVTRQGELFIFESADPELQIEGKNYFFQLYRQNRPPVLDYISQWPTKAYDYLIIPGDEKRGLLNLTATAKDPDEDKITYLFSGEDFNQFELKDSKEKLIQADTKTEDYTAVQKEGFIENITSPIKTVMVKAFDEDGLADWQEVRILVEKEPKINLKILSPYSDIKEFQTSLEDPVFVEVEYPETLSKTGSTESTLEFAGQLFTAETLKKPGCYYLDTQGLTYLEVLQCDSAAIKKQLSSIKLKEFVSPFTDLGPKEAKLDVSYVYSKDQRHEFPSLNELFSVKECLPHQQTSALDKGFFASHSCCTEKGYANKEVICKKDSASQPEAEQSCDNKGILKGKFIPTYCSGKSSYCSDGQKGEETTGSLDICGKKGIKNCDLVEDKCSGQKPNTYLSGGVCLDCQNFCEKNKNALVYIGKPESLPATLQKVSLNKDFECGCSGQDGQPCDGNFDGFFKGTCKSNKCEGEVT